MHLQDRQMEVVNKLSDPQKAIYAGIGMALRHLYGSDEGFLDGLKALKALTTTMEMALEDAKADGVVIPSEGCQKEEHY